MSRALIVTVLTLSCVVSCSAPPAANDNMNDSTTDGAGPGTELEFQDGSLPAGTTVEITEAEPPTLPSGVEAVGEAVRISLNNTVSRPVMIRMPVPDGQDPDRLSIFQVLETGQTTMLSSSHDGDSIVASTNHFTPSPVDVTSARSGQQNAKIDAIRAALGIRDAQDPPPELSRAKQGIIIGPDFLAPGQQTFYNLGGFDEYNGEALQVEWNLFASGGGLAEPGESDLDSIPDAFVLFASRSAHVAAGADASGLFTLSCSYVDPGSGLAGFANKIISIQSAEQLDDLTVQFFGGPTEVLVNEEHPGLLFGLLEETEATFTWDYGTGDAAHTGTETTTNLITPPITFESAGTYAVTVTATTANGATGALTIPIVVRSTDLQIVVVGPTTVQPISSAFDTDEYTVNISFGSPPFAIQPTLFPGGAEGTIATTSQEGTIPLRLSEPGSYVLSTTVVDQMDAKTTYAISITVTGEDPPSLTWTPESTTAPPNSALSFTFAITGGVLISNGVLTDGYTLRIDWGDGETSRVAVDAAGTRVTTEGSLPHRYDDAGTYVAVARASDATGTTAVQEVTITIEEDFDCPVPCGNDATCVDAGAAVCIDGCCFECETDDHCPSGYTCDASLVCIPPCEQCCDGDERCDTGDDCNDADCALCSVESDGDCIEDCDPPDPDCVSVINITSQGGVSASSEFASDFDPGNTLDGNTDTNWFSDGASGGDSEAFTWVRTNSGDVSITRIETDPETFKGGGGFGFGQAQVLVMNDAGDVVYESDFMVLGGSRVDLNVSLPAGIEGRSVQLILVDHQDSSCGGFSELRVYGQQ
jgi:hypothetical protein